MRLGAIPVPINARFKALELHYVIRHSGMRILVAEPTYAGLLEEADATETCRVVIGTQDPAFVAGAEGVDAATVAAALAQVGGDDDGLMLYTSGTTAHPKGCVHRHSAIVAEGERIAERLHLDVRGPVLDAAPVLPRRQHRDPRRRPRGRLRLAADGALRARRSRSTSSSRSAARSRSRRSRRSGSACSTTRASRPPT